RVRAFGPPPLQVLLFAMLPAAVADVVAASDAEDGAPRFLLRCVLHRLADHHHQLAFGMHVRSLGWNNDRTLGMLQGRYRLVQHFRVWGRGAAAEVAAVVEPQRHALAGLGGTQPWS